MMSDIHILLIVNGRQLISLVKQVIIDGVVGFTGVGIDLTITLVPSSMINSISHIDSSYFNTPDGSISLIFTFPHPGSLTYTNGTTTTTINYPNPDPNNPYSVATETLNLTNLVGGTYTFTLTSFCDTKTFTVVVGQPDEFKGMIVIPPQGFGYITAVVTGGIPPYTYQWYFNCELLKGETNSTLLIPDNPFGDYKVKVTDSTGRTITLKATVPFPLKCLIKNVCVNNDTKCLEESNKCSETECSSQPVGTLKAKIIDGARCPEYVFTWYSIKNKCNEYNINNVGHVVGNRHKLTAPAGTYIVFVVNTNNGQTTSAVGNILSDKPKDNCQLKEVCNKICEPKEVCKKTYKEVCEPKEVCKKVYRKGCEPKEVCKNEPKEVCKNEPKEVCKNESKKICKLKKVCEEVNNCDKDEECNSLSIDQSQFEKSCVVDQKFKKDCLPDRNQLEKSLSQSHLEKNSLKVKLIADKNIILITGGVKPYTQCIDKKLVFYKDTMKITTGCEHEFVVVDNCGVKKTQMILIDKPEKYVNVSIQY
jgi:hypothetical protein